MKYQSNEDFSSKMVTKLNSEKVNKYIKSNHYDSSDYHLFQCCNEIKDTEGTGAVEEFNAFKQSLDDEHPSEESQSNSLAFKRIVPNTEKVRKRTKKEQ